MSIQKEEAKKKEVLVEENVPAPSPRSNCTVSPIPVVVDNSVECVLIFMRNFTHCKYRVFVLSFCAAEHQSLERDRVDPLRG